MSYGSVAGAGALVPTWASAPVPNPTEAQVGVWGGAGYAIINRAIASAGYTTPIVADAALYPELTALENLYAAAYILRSIAIDTASGEGEERSEIWLADFYSQLKDLAASNLALVGAVPLPSTTVSRRKRIRTLPMSREDGYSDYATGN